MCYILLYNLYKYIYYNYCIYKNNDIDNNINDNLPITYNYYNHRVIDNLDDIIFNSMVCNNIEIPFYELKYYNSYNNIIGLPNIQQDFLPITENKNNDEYIIIDNKDYIKVDCIDRKDK